MAGREISSTLRNLKFMQRAVKEEKKKEDEIVSNGEFGFSPAINRKCVVIMEGDPHPGMVKGRMSFQSFNPSVDKLAEELETRSKDPVASTPNSQNGASGIVEGSLNEESDTKKDRKRKQPVTESEETQYPNKSPKNVNENQQTRASSSKKKNSKNKKNHEKNNWSVLRPPPKVKVEASKHVVM